MIKKRAFQRMMQALCEMPEYKTQTGCSLADVTNASRVIKVMLLQFTLSQRRQRR